MRVSEIRVKRIRVNQGLGVIVFFLKKTMLRHVCGFLLHQTSCAEFVKRVVTSSS